MYKPAANKTRRKQQRNIRTNRPHFPGLPGHDLVWYGSSATRNDLIKRLQFLEPGKGFRSTYQYNNLMFMDVKGNISRVSLPLQEGVKDIEFTRVPGKKDK